MKCICGNKMSREDPSTFSRSDLGGRYHCNCGWSMSWNRIYHTAHWRYQKGFIFAFFTNSSNGSHDGCEIHYNPSGKPIIHAADTSIKLGRVNTAVQLFECETGKEVLKTIQRLLNLKAFL